LVILSGGIDLSVGSVFACAGIVGGLVFQATGNLWLTLAATLLTGAALGSLNGLFISQLRVPPFHRNVGHAWDGSRSGFDPFPGNPNLWL
jgi:ribose/xylose/arabinose/galactoside ABC-type transport system permease subunit